MSLAFSLIFSFLLSLSSILTAHAAHSRTRPVVIRSSHNFEDRYDRAITTFDSSGRLLQVEYGRQAANRGSSLLAYIHESSSNASTNSDETEPTTESIYILIPSSSSFSKVHRLDHHIFLFTSGLAGDGRFLANYLRRYIQSFTRWYGEAPSARRVAQTAAQVQHTLTRTAGARPLGVTAVVAGVGDTRPGSTEAASAAMRLYRTDPGGVLEDCLYVAAGQKESALLKAMASDIVQRKLEETKKNGSCESQIIKVLMETVSEALGDKQLSMDVWVLKRNVACRGNLHATCLLNVKMNQGVGDVSSDDVA